MHCASPPVLGVVSDQQPIESANETLNQLNFLELSAVRLGNCQAAIKPSTHNVQLDPEESLRSKFQSFESNLVGFRRLGATYDTEKGSHRMANYLNVSDTSLDLVGVIVEITNNTQPSRNSFHVPSTVKLKPFG